MYWYIKALKQFLDFNGRASRIEYWGFTFINLLVSFLVSYYDTQSVNAGGLGIFSLVYTVLIMLPSIAIGFRRMHDLGKPGWYIFIPIYNFILSLTKGEQESNKFGEVPSDKEGHGFDYMHFVAIALFMVVTSIYFAPQYNDFGLKQHDIEQFKGAANEIEYHREIFDGEEPLWTNSMFGGMPATQISVLYDGNIARALLSGFRQTYKMPAAGFLLHLICFYILAMFLRIKPIIGILGAFAFAFASYEIIILQAGHNSKAIAVAFAPAVLGAFIYAFRRNWMWGAIFSAIFMAFEMTANHLQVTYYLAFLFLPLGIYFLFQAISEKELKKFGLATVGVIAGYGLAIFMNYGNISTTADYTEHTIRGNNDVTIAPNGELSTIATNGLDKEYITQWSYGKDESFTFISPYVKGSHSMPLFMTQFVEDAEELEDLSRAELKEAMNMGLYWGEQPIVSGPFYLGIVVFFLAFLAMFFVRDKKVWILVGVSLLALMLSWGKNFMGLTDFFIDNVPGYNKFRTVTIILVLIELCIPVLAILLLQQLYDNREKIKGQKTMFLIASSIFMVFLLALRFSGGNSSYKSSADDRRIEQVRASYMDQIMAMDPAVARNQYQLDLQNPAQVNQFIEANMEGVYTGLEGIKKVRKGLYVKSTNRSLGYGVLAIIIVGLFFFTSWNSMIMVGALIGVVLLDLVPVNRNYLGTFEDKKGDMYHWVPEPERAYPIVTNAADHAIMEAEVKENPELAKVIQEGAKMGEEKATELGYTGRQKRRVLDSYKFQSLGSKTNYRVFDYDGAWSSSRASYFHKSLGGYHGAKLRNIQNVFDFHISRSNNAVLNMLNVKYFIQGGQMRPNPQALGNAWAVKKVNTYEIPNDEIRALGKEFTIENVGSGTLLVNQEVYKKTSAKVYGGEDLRYVLPTGDTLEVPISNGISSGMKAYFVADRNGETNLLPEFTINLDTANSFTKYVSYEVTYDFDPANEATMLDEYAEKLSSKEFSGEATVTMTSYAANELKYKVDAKGNQLIVFSEIFYNDGWKAFIDGEEKDILKIDYLLRGLEVADGNHEVVFQFDLDGYHSSETKAYISSIILILLVLGGLFVDYRKKKNVA